MERSSPPGRRVGAVFVVVLVLIPAVALAGEPLVSFHDGLVTATFDAVVAPRALEAIRRATGVEIVILRPIHEQTVTLTADEVPFERFIQLVLDALELGGFALVYEHDGGASRVIVADKGRADTASSAWGPAVPARSSSDVRTPAAPAGAAEPARASVIVLVRPADAESSGLGRPGVVIVVESAPIEMVQASECGGGDYPLQNVTVSDGTTGHFTSIVVCERQGLAPGNRLTLGYAQTDADDSPPGARYSKFIATLQ